MNKYLNLLIKNLSIDISFFFSHKQATFFQFIADIFEFLIQPLILFFIYEISQGFSGWNMNEMFFLIATARISLTIAGSTVLGMIFSNSWKLEQGYFHQVLLKPFNTIIYMMITSINAHWVMDILSGFGLLIYSLIKLNIQATIAGFFSYIYLIFISLLCYYGITGLILNFLFKNPRSSNIMDMFWTMTNFSKYPLNIFPNYLKFLLTFILPVMISGYYPASYFLGKSNDFNLMIVFSLIGIIFAIVGTFAIKDGIKKHVSFGG
jgi:ABC-2 type transport system permease protein